MDKKEGFVAPRLIPSALETATVTDEEARDFLLSSGHVEETKGFVLLRLLCSMSWRFRTSVSSQICLRSRQSLGEPSFHPGSFWGQPDRGSYSRLRPRECRRSGCVPGVPTNIQDVPCTPNWAQLRLRLLSNTDSAGLKLPMIPTVLDFSSLPSSFSVSPLPFVERLCSFAPLKFAGQTQGQSPLSSSVVTALGIPAGWV